MNKIVFKAVTDAAQRREELSKESERVELRRVDVQAEDAIGEAMSIGSTSIRTIKSAASDLEKAIRAARNTISITEKYIPMAEGLGDKQMTTRLRKSERDAKDLIKQFEKIQRAIKAL